MVEVSAGLFLGNEDDAEEIVYGKRHKPVTHILSVTRDPPAWLLTKPKPESELLEEQTTPTVEEGGAKSEADKPRRDLTTLHIQANDTPKVDLLGHFEQCCLFIQQGLDQGAVLVHCIHGISRSATIVLAYLMKKEGRRLELVLKNVQQKKPDIRPNPGFMEQLKLWGAMRCRINQNYKPYKAYRLQHHSATYSMTTAEEIAAGFDGQVEKLPLAVDPAVQEVESTAYYRCRKCRRLLFTEDSVLQHKLGEGMVAFNPYLHVEETLNSCGESESACSSYFIEPVEWMDHVVSSGEVTGKVLCPKCESKLGSYSWSGQQCSCGRRVIPSFQVHKGRVDEVRSLAKRKPTQT